MIPERIRGKIPQFSSKDLPKFLPSNCTPLSKLSRPCSIGSYSGAAECDKFCRMGRHHVHGCICFALLHIHVSGKVRTVLPDPAERPSDDVKGPNILVNAFTTLGKLAKELFTHKLHFYPISGVKSMMSEYQAAGPTVRGFQAGGAQRLRPVQRSTSATSSFESFKTVFCVKRIGSPCVAWEWAPCCSALNTPSGTKAGSAGETGLAAACCCQS